jgi:hypothetical protein
VHNWTEAEYVRWLNEHGEEDRIQMVRRVLATWEAEHPEEGVEEDEFVQILHTVLDRVVPAAKAEGAPA